MIAAFILRAVLALAIGGIDVLDAGSLSSVTDRPGSRGTGGVNGGQSTTSSARGTDTRPPLGLKSTTRPVSTRSRNEFLQGNDKIVGKGPATDTVGGSASDGTAP